MPDRLTPELEAEAREWVAQDPKGRAWFAAWVAEVDRLRAELRDAETDLVALSDEPTPSELEAMQELEALRAHPLVEHEEAVWRVLRTRKPRAWGKSGYLRCVECSAGWRPHEPERHAPDCSYAALPNAVKERL